MSGAEDGASVGIGAAGAGVWVRQHAVERVEVDQAGLEVDEVAVEEDLAEAAGERPGGRVGVVDEDVPAVGFHSGVAVGALHDGEVDVPLDVSVVEEGGGARLIYGSDDREEAGVAVDEGPEVERCRVDRRCGC